jgi:hypothetical protein
VDLLLMGVPEDLVGEVLYREVIQSKFRNKNQIPPGGPKRATIK